MAMSWRMLVRDWRAGELRLLGLALLLAVASLTSVSFFTDRLGQALTREANQLLGGDLLLAADHPFDPAFRAQAEARGLRVLGSLSFPSMASAGDAVQLAGVKAVEPGHPLRGSLRTAPGLNQPDAPAAGIPARGTVWLDERLTTALGVKPGDTLALGNARFTVGAVLTFESDRGASFFSIVPRLMLDAADLPATGLVQVGSRITYRLHVAGEPKAVKAYRQWAQGRLERGEKLEDIENARPEVRTALDRAQRFLKLAALLAVVLAAVAVGLAARRFMQRHLDGCAVMRCLGARQAQLSRLFLGEFLLFGALGSALGCALGYLAQLGIERVLASLLNGSLPAPGPLPVLHGFAVGMALLAGFVAPQLARLGKVSTVRVLRREWDDARPLTLASYGAGFAALAGLMFWVAEDARLGAIVVAGFAAAMALYLAAARLALVALGRVRGAAGAGWRYGLASLRRRLAPSLLQAMALGIGLTAILLLTLTRGELMAAWRNSVPPDAPNRFVINIQPEQREPMRALFRDSGLTPPELLPMVRGRLVAVNGRAVNAEGYGEARAQRLVEREFNLSYMAALPAGNSLVAGRWFGPAGTHAAQFSVEVGLAKTLGLELGDEVAFEIAGNRVEARVTSLRKLDWDSMRVNFFVIAPPGLIDGFPTSFITSFHLEPAQAAFANRLVEAFPNITLIDVAAILRQFQSVTDQIAAAVQFVFLFAIACALVVLFAALEATHDERAYELAVMRTLGARNGQLRAALAAEFAALGAVAGLLGGAGAEAISYVLATEAFKLAYTPSLYTPLVGALAGTLGVTLAGLAGTARVFRVPALQSLRALG